MSTMEPNPFFLKPCINFIEMYNNNLARYSLIEINYRQMAFQSPSDGAPISPNQQSLGTPGQTKVSVDRQRETTQIEYYHVSKLLLCK